MESRGTIREGPVRVRSLYLGRTSNRRALEPFRHCSNREPSPSTGAVQTGSRSDPDRGSRSRTAGLAPTRTTRGHRAAAVSLPLRNPYPIGGSGPFCRPLIVGRRRHCWASLSVLRGCKLNIDVARKYP